MTYRCSCGFSTASLERFEDHLFTFPEDDHYELASGHQGTALNRGFIRQVAARTQGRQDEPQR
jgi:hypothetical protein